MQDLPSPAQKYLPIGKAAKAFGVSIDTIRRWNAAGKIKVVRTPGGTRLIPFSEIERIHQSGAQDPITIGQETRKPPVSIQATQEPINISGLGLLEKAIHHLRFTRPAWYHHYHSWDFTTSLHYIIMILMVTATGTLVFYNLVIGPGINKTREDLAQQIGSVLPAVTPPRILSFQGRLTNASDVPISTPTNIVFRIWDQASGGTEVACDGGGDEDCMWKSKTWIVTPDQNGIFSVLLGDTTQSDTAIPSTLFSENDPLYLGVKVETDAEMTPRQRIASVSYALNSDSLDGVDSLSFLRSDASDSFTSGTLTTSDGTTLTVNSTTIGIGNASSDTLTVDATGTFNTDVDFSFGGTENLVLTSDGVGGSSDSFTLTVTPSASTGTLRGVVISQASSANTNPLDAALVIDNADNDVTIGDAISITNTGGGGTPYTNLFNSPTLDITGTGAITGATGITSSGTITFSSMITDANAVLYTTTAGVVTRVVETETGSQCLLSGAGASGVPSWGACGGSQTPWTSDIDADGFDLVDLSNIEFRDTTGAPAGTITAIFRDNTGDLNLNALTGKTINLQVAGVDEYNFSSTALEFNSNNITGLGTNLTSAAGLAIATTTTGALSLDTGTTGNITIGTNANAKTITMGNTSVGTTVVINSAVVGTAVTIDLQPPASLTPQFGLNVKPKLAAGGAQILTGIEVDPDTANGAGTDIFTALDLGGIIQTAAKEIAIRFGPNYDYELEFEGTTSDANEIFLTAADAQGSDKVITLPDISGTVLLFTPSAIQNANLAGNINLVDIQGTPSITAGTAYGLKITQANSANSNGFDATLVIDNADIDLAIGDAISITNTGGGGYTNYLNTPTIDITGAGAITGATGITSSGTITFSSMITDANAVLYTTTTGVVTRVVETETGSQCLLSGAGASGVPTWGACSGGSVTLDAIQPAGGPATRDHNANTITWQWDFTAADTGLTIGEASASTGGAGDQFLLDISTFGAASTASPLRVTNNSADSADIIFNLAQAGDLEIRDANTAFAIFADDGSITLGKASAASTIDIGKGTGVDAINIGTGGTAADTIIFGNTGVATTFAFNTGVSTTTGMTLTANSLSGGTGLSVTSSGTITTGGELVQFTGNSTTTGTLFDLSATGLTTGKAINLTARASSGTSMVNFDFAPNNTGAVTVQGLNIDWTQQSLGGTTEQVVRIRNVDEAWGPADTTLSTLLLLDNADTTVNQSVVVSDALRISCSPTSNQIAGCITNGINLTGLRGHSSTAITGINIDTLNSAGAGFESAIKIATGWDASITFGNGTSVSNTELGTIRFGRQSSSSSTTCASGSAQGIVFRDEGGTQRGHFCVDTTGQMEIFAAGVTAGTDVAENYSDADNALEAGDLVISGGNLSVTKTSAPYNEKIIGVVSTKPGYLLSGIDEATGNTDLINPRPIALIGRVPVKVSTEGGDIAPGDPLTSSSTPGVAMRATRSGPIVGKALEGYTGSGVGKIMVFVSVGWYVAPITSSAQQATSLDGLTDINVATLTAGTIHTDVLFVGDRKLAMGPSGELVVDGDVNILGDTNVSGNLKVGEEILGKNLRVEKINLDIPQPESDGTSNASVGSETLRAGETRVIVKTTKVTADSRIFVTPTSKTGKVLSVTSQEEGKSFIVELVNPSNNAIRFNWWIVN